jgi:hypothetical protein
VNKKQWSAKGYKEKKCLHEWEKRIDAENAGWAFWVCKKCGRLKNKCFG